MSLRRELALRTVFSGADSTRPSLAPIRVTAFSGVAPRTSALAGAGGARGVLLAVSAAVLLAVKLAVGPEALGRARA